MPHSYFYSQLPKLFPITFCDWLMKKLLQSLISNCVMLSVHAAGVAHIGHVDWIIIAYILGDDGNVMHDQSTGQVCMIRALGRSA